MDRAGKNEVNIICLYWSGDFRGRDFCPADVNRLHQSVAKWIDRPFNFYVLTNAFRDQDMLPGKLLALNHNWPGWWSKMELHRPDLPEGRTLYLDLDSHVISSLAPILDHEGDLVMFRSRASGSRTGVVRRYQAATMLFTPGATSQIYDRFCEAPDRYMVRWRSDQDVMGKWLPDQPTFPDRWMMKLRQCNGVPPEDTIIVTGQPSDGSFRRLDEEYPWLEERARG